MKHELLNVLVLACLFLMMFALTEAGYHLLKIKAEWTRKFAHLTTGLLALLFPVMLQSHWSVLLLCFSFFIILQLSLKFNFLKSINDIHRESAGSLAYPVSVYGCYLVFCLFDRQYFYFYLPVLILAISDPSAAIVGKYLGGNKINGEKGKKTIMGSMVFFLSAYMLTFVLILVFKNEKSTLHIFMYSALIALFATLAEAFTGKGWDNITIPAAVLIGVSALEYIT